MKSLSLSLCARSRVLRYVHELFHLIANMTAYEFHMCIMFVYSVKLSIKSFKVPELFIEVPESTTIGSLKVCNFPVLPYVCQEGA